MVLLGLGEGLLTELLHLGRGKPSSTTSVNEISDFELWISYCCRNWVMKASNAGLSLSGANSKAISASARASSMRPNCW
jgi:hypothetical protein